MRKSFLSFLFCATCSLTMFARAEIREEGSKLEYAAAQHEVISILLRSQKYDRVLGEFRKILALGFEGEEEELLVREAWMIVEELRSAGQYSIAEQVVKECLLQIKDPENQFKLLMLQGKISQDQGYFEEAIQIYRKAQQLRWE